MTELEYVETLRDKVAERMCDTEHGLGYWAGLLRFDSPTARISRVFWVRHAEAALSVVAPKLADLDKQAAGAVAALPAPDGVDAGVAVWTVRHDAAEVQAFVEDSRPYVAFMYGDTNPDDAEQLGLAIVAAARYARRQVAAFSRGGGLDAA